jgi:gas vesicle protein
MAHSHSVKEYPKQIVGIAALSAVVGAVGAMLFTPKRGTELRGGLKRRASLMKKSMARSKNNMQATAKDTAEKAKKDTKQTAARTRTAAKRATKAMEAEAERIRRQGEP